MVINNMPGLLFLCFLCIMIPKIYSFENNEQEVDDDSITESYIDKHMPFFFDQRSIINKPIDIDNLHLESTATQHPDEYFRGKRFWLFAKKDDNNMNVDLMSNANNQQNSLAQGLWRSGLVGRRRRRHL